MLEKSINVTLQAKLILQIRSQVSIGVLTTENVRIKALGTGNQSQVLESASRIDNILVSTHLYFCCSFFSI